MNLKAILKKCTDEDFQYVSEVLDNYASFTNDSKRKKLLRDPSKREELIDLLDEQIRYFGSADLAYFARAVSSRDPGISSSELVADVCEKLKVKIRQGASIEAMLEQLVAATVDKELRSKSAEDLAKTFRDFKIGDKERDLFLEHVKTKGEVLVPLLIEVLGPKVATGVIETVVVGIIARFIGQQAAKKLVTEVIKRNPWLNALGPAVWVASGAWLAFDMQGPAFRKTIPICLYLGLVALRDGREAIAATEVA
ncbi:hypothetical protein ACFWZ1_09335 [Frateuria sp. GZRe14]|uniref:hypothetical protein n=1 Tax=Frateuria sp. GZRe14 TaxID=3351534 RepID=UPI003EDBA840